MICTPKEVSTQPSLCLCGSKFVLIAFSIFGGACWSVQVMRKMLAPACIYWRFFFCLFQWDKNGRLARYTPFYCGSSSITQGLISKTAQWACKNSRSSIFLNSIAPSVFNSFLINYLDVYVLESYYINSIFIYFIIDLCISWLWPPRLELLIKIFVFSLISS